MKDNILSNLDNPAQLERLYRADRSAFRRAFNALSPELIDNRLAAFWNERLNFPAEEIAWGTRQNLVFVLLGSVLAGVLAKVPAFTGIDEEFYYSRNIGFIVFSFLMAFFAWRNALSVKKVGFLAGATLLGLIFINSLPNAANSDTLILSCVHLVFFLWSLLGFAYAGDLRSDNDRRLGFLRYNGELVVMGTLIVIAGAVMTGVTLNLFTLIGINIEKFYFQNIVVCGLAAAPIIGTHLTHSNPQLVGKVSPVIARIFSPLVLVMLSIYLGAMLYSGKDPYNDREFLLIFNALLIGVLAIILFSVAGTSGSDRGNLWILFLLSAVTIIVNGIALSAIVFRISEWGITPNRAAVLGGNVLILVNLLLVAARLFSVITNRSDIGRVGNGIALYLPIYFVWIAIVTFIFPFIFGFR